jgi:bifunctional UDP-N-acetylglucosamine pyrophosphorylase / glucosamine-1-phosphate N-acetyltransferase
MTESAADEDGNPNVAVVILTAGRGTRMRSELPKVLHPIAGQPMTEHVLRAAEGIHPGQIIATLGPPSEILRETFAGRCAFAWQAEAFGTGDAARVALPLLNAAIEWVVVIFGDHPLVDSATLQTLIDSAQSAEPLLATVAVVLPEPGPYGRYRRDERGRITGIIEAHEDPNTYDGPTPVNSGMCCIRRDWLEEHIGRVPLAPKGEYYLTALVELAAATDWHTDPVLLVIAPPEVAYGINDRVELASAERILRQRINERHMRAGVTLVDPAATYIDIDVTIGSDTRIAPGCVLRGSTRIGANCQLGPGTTLEDSRLGDGVVVRGSWIESSDIGDGVDIGPYAHLRPGTRISPHVHIGNFVETKNAVIGSGTAIGHVSYIGDAELGERVNVGAGTITCNFDGREKHQTTVGDDVFIGSDSMLVAPVTLASGSRTGAGSVVTKDVAAGALVVGVPARPIGARRSRASNNQPESGRQDTGQGENEG